MTHAHAVADEATRREEEEAKGMRVSAHSDALQRLASELETECDGRLQRLEAHVERERSALVATGPSVRAAGMCVGLLMDGHCGRVTRSECAHAHPHALEQCPAPSCCMPTSLCLSCACLTVSDGCH